MKKNTVKFNAIKKKAKEHGFMSLFDGAYSEARRLAPSLIGKSNTADVPSTDALEKKARKLIECWYESPTKVKLEWEDFKIVKLGFLAIQAMKQIIVKSWKEVKINETTIIHI